MIKDRRLRFGEVPRRWDRVSRLQVYLDPADWWIGFYLHRAEGQYDTQRSGRVETVFVCPLPCLVFRWER